MKDHRSISDTEHPGLGRRAVNITSKATMRTHLPDGMTRLTYALVGNQNCGKDDPVQSTDRCEPACWKLPGGNGGSQGWPDQGLSEYVRSRICPGIYSMSPYSSEEIVSRNFVLHGQAEGDH